MVAYRRVFVLGQGLTRSSDTPARVLNPTPHSEVGSHPTLRLLGFRASPKFPHPPAWLVDERLRCDLEFLVVQPLWLGLGRQV